MTPQTKRFLSYALVAVWMVVIFVFSSQDSEASDQQSGLFVGLLGGIVGEGGQEGLLTFATRKAAHIFLYLVLGALLYHVVRQYSLPLRRAVLLSIAIACLYAVSDEIHQLYIPGRSGEVRDVLIDTAASGVGVGAYALVDKRRVGKKLQKDV